MTAAEKSLTLDEKVVAVLGWLKAGISVTDIAAQFRLSPKTIRSWQRQFGSAPSETVRRIRELTRTNRALERELDQVRLELSLLQDSIKKKSILPSRGSSSQSCALRVD